MKYFIAALTGVVASVLFVLTTPEDYVYLSWFVYLITFFGVLLGQTLEDIENGIRHQFL